MSRWVVMGDLGYFMMIFELGQRMLWIFKEFKLLQKPYDFLLGRGLGAEEGG